MSLNDTPSSERLHIGIFGKRNAGKSSLINAICRQELSIVSDIPGTTNDPVKKAVEIFPLGPVVLIDTPGIDDCGVLGELRVRKTLEILSQIDLGLLIIDATVGASDSDSELVSLFEEKQVPYIEIYNKSDLKEAYDRIPEKLYVSANNGDGIAELNGRIAEKLGERGKKRGLVDGLVKENELVMLIMSLDEAAPKGRLILPQQQTIRAISDKRALSLVIDENEIDAAFSKLKSFPDLIIADSKIINRVAAKAGASVKLTTFSILFAMYKGILGYSVKSLYTLDKLENGDSVLISEACTHQKTCGDIGSERIPELVEKYSGKNLRFSFTSGSEFPGDLSGFKLIVHCGGCMINDASIRSRMNTARAQGIAFTNYGLLLSKISGVLDKVVEPFKDIADLQDTRQI